MDEYSRILIEEYCMNHNSEKSRRLFKLCKSHMILMPNLLKVMAFL